MTQNPGRRYESPLRRDQAEQTRERILDAVIAELAEGGLHSFSVGEAAARAGVSQRTVYRHFPDRESLIAALDERSTPLLRAEVPERIEELGRVVDRMFPLFEAHEELVRARLQTDLGQEARIRERRKRAAWLEALVCEGVPHLSEQGRRRASALLHHLLSSETWRMMKDEYGLDAAESAPATRWAVELIVRALKEEGSGLDDTPAPAVPHSRRSRR